jgi:hypothetical protein
MDHGPWPVAREEIVLVHQRQYSEIPEVFFRNFCLNKIGKLLRTECNYGPWSIVHSRLHVGWLFRVTDIKR